MATASPAGTGDDESANNGGGGIIDDNDNGEEHEGDGGRTGNGGASSTETGSGTSEHPPTARPVRWPSMPRIANHRPTNTLYLAKIYSHTKQHSNALVTHTFVATLNYSCLPHPPDKNLLKFVSTVRLNDFYKIPCLLVYPTRKSEFHLN
jgi:hypothetical protein